MKMYAVGTEKGRHPNIQSSKEVILKLFDWGAGITFIRELVQRIQ